MAKNFIKPKFANKVIDKSQLKKIIIWAFRNYGIARAANMADKLKDLGFHYATKAGISLSLEDLRIPPEKQNLLYDTIKSIEDTDNRHKRGEITVVERFQKVIDTWNSASETLKKEVIKYFRNTDPLNTIYMMAFSGARGNISQVRQLVGMRGLMSDPQGQIIDLPISSNFREGLTITDYFISSYGARKGLVDTALRTADSGYLTRRLVDVAQDVIIREVNCKTSQGILLENMVDSNKVLINLEQALIGRVLAENILNPHSGVLIARCSQVIDPWLANKIVELGYKGVLVRSPITCNSIRSVCQLCYGWNLAHGKVVDLGEAVGIIAAQSIGEPGTQLTMRTFHTGGVFTGELAQKIINKKDAKIEYLGVTIVKARTRHGDQAKLVNADCKLKLTDFTGVEQIINLVKGTLLLVEDNIWVKAGQIIAEYPLSNRLITEKAQKLIITDFSGSVSLEAFDSKEVHKKQNEIYSMQNSGILWILSGIVYSIPEDAELIVSVGQSIDEHSLLARTQLISKHSGYVRIIDSYGLHQQLSVITSSKTFTNIKAYLDDSYGYNNYILELDTGDKFLLDTSSNQKILHNQIVGNLITDVYKTQTGGIIKYLDLPISKIKSNNNSDYYDILGSGYVLWIPEETHEVNKDVSLLLVNHGDFIEIGTEIIKNVFANNAGILEVIQRDGIIREIIIKPGKVYSIDINDLNLISSTGKFRGFLRPGEQIVNGIITDKLVYWEYIQSKGSTLILIRPVIVYSVPNRNLKNCYTADSFGIDMFNLKIMRRTYFRDGARVKSVYGIDLVKTYLVAQLNPIVIDMFCTLDFVKSSINGSYLSLKLSTADILSLKELAITSDKSLHTETLIKVQDNQYIENGSVLAQTEILSSVKGRVEYIQQNDFSTRRLLITTKMDMRTFFIDHEQFIKVKTGDWVYAGDEIATNLITYFSGKIINIVNNKITIRIGQPYLISSGSILHVYHNSLIQRGENLATLMFERAKTGDIVQGLPRIEEILEARKKSETSFNPHLMLESNFRSYLTQGLSLHDATRSSLLDIQLFLIKEVQLVYQSQGVEISDKHIEVIVRQMTSKVKIENGGDTDYLPGEIIELQKVESVNRSLLVMNKNQALYHPILLGITKASLNTESFISAASFQETTKVLTEAAISGKLDWLRGLKENVIIGRLIPAGTGFNIYTNPLLNIKNNVLNPHLNQFESNKNTSDSSFEDIILDDRTARNYPKIYDSDFTNKNKL
uniref:DNA-directed RNA polymerase subunit beta'' n=1 Tax=Caulacanthus okamurae TaxID=152008 RepID=A0A6H1U9H0_9FLOR|nr:RNA polymerase beta'' subunit [Caulacanthus okamurae]QIZ74703.1 RNA polymerase beta'' subunit [Caulacanthus okamurae]